MKRSKEHRLCRLSAFLLALFFLLGCVLPASEVMAKDITDEEEEELLDNPWETVTEEEEEEEEEETTEETAEETTEEAPPSPPEPADLQQTLMSWRNLEGKGKESKVSLSEKELELVKGHLGCGMDVFKDYAGSQCEKLNFLDLDSLIADGKVYRVFIDYTDNIYVEGRTAKEYMNSLSVKVGVSGSYGIFSGSIDTKFNETQSKSEHFYYASMLSIIKVFEVYIARHNVEELKPYVLAKARELLDSDCSAKELFDVYGHYVDLDSILGGRAELNMSQKATLKTSFKSFSVKTSAAANAFIASAKISSEVETSASRSESESLIRGQITTKGGPGVPPFTYEEYQNDRGVRQYFADKVLDRPALVAYGTRSGVGLVPLWEFCSDPQRAEYLRNEFERMARDQQQVFPEAMIYDYISDITFSHFKSADKARAKVPAGYKIIGGNEDIDNGSYTTYICAKFTNKPQEAIKFVVLRKDKPENRPEYFNHLGQMYNFWPCSAIEENGYYAVNRADKNYYLYASFDPEDGPYLLDIRFIRSKNKALRDEEWRALKEQGYEPIYYCNSEIVADWNKGWDEYIYGFMLRTPERNNLGRNR